MAVPSFQELTLPILKLAGDGIEHTVKEACGHLAELFKLSPTEVDEMLPSGRQSRFRNRVAWAVAYLKSAVLVDSTGRGRFRISDRGRDVLKKPPTRIDIAFLMQFPEVRAFRGGGKAGAKAEPVPEESASLGTPEEVIEVASRQLREQIAAELLQKVKSCPPHFFEQLVVDLLVKMGYGGTLADAGKVVGKSGDGGIDGVIKEDRLGLDSVYVQAKRWQSGVGEPTVREFAGSLEGQRARKGVLITTSTFSADARAYVSKIDKKIILIDGVTLVQYMLDYGVGVVESAHYSLYRIDSDYFEEAE
jgi:restriction system protein